jgi:peptidoglycan/LPS O-acetylase OafA/YrhL
MPDRGRTLAQRHHDLDALRGAMMLLGIVIHVALAFIPDVWVVTDAQASTDGLFGVLVSAIHGFRMPVFFLLSGFFTTLLIKKQGLRGMVKQRVLRVLLPLGIGVCTIGPLVVAASLWAVMSRPVDNVWTAIQVDDMGALRRELRDLDNPPAIRSPDDGATPLHLAVYMTNRNAVAALLDAGFEMDAENQDGATPFGLAYYFGAGDIADLFVAYGHPDPRPQGIAWSAMPGFGDGSEWAPRNSQASGLVQLHHLWFLWFLWWFVVGYVLVASLPKRLATVGFICRVKVSAGRLIWALIPLTVIPQYWMWRQGATPQFGPETSAEWFPAAHVFAYYAIFFAFGALLYGRTTSDGRPLFDAMVRPWWAVLFATLAVVLPVALAVTFARIDVLQVPWWSVTVLQVVYTWGMVLGLMGLFRRVFSVERRGVRYLSDSSYWLYLAHLPLVIAVQNVTWSWNLPAGLKFVAVCLVVTVMLLCVYHACVRDKWIGRLLNGRRSSP